MTSNAKGDKLPLRVNPHYPGMIMQGDDDGFSAAYAQAYSEKGLNEGESKKMANERANLIVNAVNAKPLMTDGRGERGSENHSGAQETGAGRIMLTDEEMVDIMAEAILPLVKQYFRWSITIGDPNVNPDAPEDTQAELKLMAHFQKAALQELKERGIL